MYMKLVTPLFRFPQKILVVYVLTDKSRLVCHHKFGVCSVESVNVKLWLKKKGRGPFNNYVDKMREEGGQKCLFLSTLRI